MEHEDLVAVCNLVMALPDYITKAKEEKDKPPYETNQALTAIYSLKQIISDLEDEIKVEAGLKLPPENIEGGIGRAKAMGKYRESILNELAVIQAEHMSWHHKEILYQ